MPDVMQTSAKSIPSRLASRSASATKTVGAASRLAPMRLAARSISSAPVTTRRTRRILAQRFASASSRQEAGVSGRVSVWTEAVSEG